MNALSNIAFLLAAVSLWRDQTLNGLSPQARRAVHALCLATGSIGLGSAAFHMLATRGSQVLDVVPISMFIVAALWLAVRWIFEGSPRRAALAVGSLVLATGVAAWAMTAMSCRPDMVTSNQFWPCLNGSWPYLPTLGALLLCAGIARRHGMHTQATPATSWLAAATGTFGVALLARCLDLLVCGQGLRISLHALWHFGAAITVYSVLRALITAAPQQDGGRIQDRRVT